MKFMKIAEYSKYIGLPVTTLRSMAKDKEIPALKRGTAWFIETSGADKKLAEYVNIENAWFNELILMAFENNTIVENEFPFGFTPSDVELSKLIEAQ